MPTERKPRTRKSTAPGSSDAVADSTSGDGLGRVGVEGEISESESPTESSLVPDPLVAPAIVEPTILLMYSGGLDSLGALHTLLTDCQYFRQGLHVHHIHIHNQEGRNEAEAQAVKQTLDYFRQPAFRPFSYSESEMSFPTFGKNFMWDTDAVGFTAASICLACPSITKVALGLTKTDFGMRVPPGLFERLERRDHLLALFGSMGKIFYPQGDLTKQEIYAGLPPDVRDFAWSCRTPVKQGDSFKACGLCRSCLHGIPNTTKKL